MRVIIDIKDGVNEVTAVRLVLSVIRKGRISSDYHGTPHFCWASTSPDGFVVYTRRKKTPESADSFVVERNAAP